MPWTRAGSVRTNSSTSPIPSVAGASRSATATVSTLLDEIAGNQAAGDAYDHLPESIKGNYSRKEWMWLSDSEKVNLVTNECMPEAFDE